MPVTDDCWDWWSPVLAEMEAKLRFQCSLREDLDDLLENKDSTIPVQCSVPEGTIEITFNGLKSIAITSVACITKFGQKVATMTSLKHHHRTGHSWWSSLDESLTKIGDTCCNELKADLDTNSFRTNYENSLLPDDESSKPTTDDDTHKKLAAANKLVNDLKAVEESLKADLKAQGCDILKLLQEKVALTADKVRLQESIDNLLEQEDEMKMEMEHKADETRELEVQLDEHIQHERELKVAIDHQTRMNAALRGQVSGHVAHIKQLQNGMQKQEDEIAGLNGETRVKAEVAVQPRDLNEAKARLKRELRELEDSSDHSDHPRVKKRCVTPVDMGLGPWS